MLRPKTFTHSRQTVPAWLIFVALIFVSSCAKPTQRNSTAAPSTNAISQVFTGRVVRIADGDTVTILDGTNAQHRIRLQGIDAPESHQAFGTQSKRNLSNLIFDREVTVEYEKTDQYGRIVGKIWLNGTDVNLEQIKSGMAWHYKEYQREQSAADRELYVRAEDEARSAHRGLWADSDPIEPSAFRKEQKREREDAR